MNVLKLNYFFFKFFKKLHFGIYNYAGRNFSGRICVYHKGGGHKLRYKVVDFYRRLNTSGILYKTITDSKRTSFLGLVFYDNGLISLIPLVDGVIPGSKIFSGVHATVNQSMQAGSTNTLKNISLFSMVNNIELVPFFGSNIARAAGTSALLVGRQEKISTLKLNSGWLIHLSNDCLASLGYVSNILHKLSRVSKAGISRAKHRKPVVRGVAMNPCDHPHGGGEGKTSALRAAKSPWGWLTKGTPSKKKKKDKLKRKLFKNIR